MVISSRISLYEWKCGENNEQGNGILLIAGEIGIVKHKYSNKLYCIRKISLPK